MILAAAGNERTKLAAQPLPRSLLLLCAVGPVLFAVLLQLQGGSPADAILGAWVHTSGFAVSLVVLSFSGNWGLPLIAGLAAGDIFSSEDRHGTWAMILCRSASRRDIFLAKVVTAGTLVVGLQTVVALASIAAGVVFVGASSIPGLDGTLLSSAHALALVAGCWLACVLPTLGFTSIAILVSVATRSGIAGVLAPGIAALAMQLLLLVGHGTVMHTALLSNGYAAWHRLLAGDGTGALVSAGLVSLVWIAACLAAAWVILRRRDIDTASRRKSAVFTAAAFAGTIALLAATANLGSSEISSARLSRSVTRVFLSLAVLQQQELGRPVPASQRFGVEPLCAHNSATTQGGLRGPGSWTCTLTLLLPTFPGDQRRFTPTILSYDVSVQQDGCWKAQTSSGLQGGSTMTDAQGNTILNPLGVIYGC